MSEPVQVEDVTATRKEGDRWAVRWVEVIRNGRKFSRRSKREVNAERARLLKLEARKQPKVVALDDLHLDSTAASWRRAQETVGNEAILAVANGDDATGKKLQRLAATLATLATSALAMMGVEALESKLEEATEHLKELRRRISTEHAAQPAAGGKALPGMGRADGPSDPLCRSEPAIPS